MLKEGFKDERGKCIETEWCRSELKLLAMVFYTSVKDMATKLSPRGPAAIAKRIYDVRGMVVWMTPCHLP